MNSKITYHEAQDICLSEMNKLFCNVPFAKEFHSGEKTDLNYYIRHVIEIILRIKLNNTLLRISSMHLCIIKINELPR